MQFLVFCSIPTSPGTVSSCMGKLARDMVVRMETTDRELQASYVQIGDVYWIPEHTRTAGLGVSESTISFEIWKSIVCFYDSLPLFKQLSNNCAWFGKVYDLENWKQWWIVNYVNFLRPTTMLGMAQFRCSLPTTSHRDFQLPGEEIKETEKHDARNERKFNDAEAKKWFFELPQVSNFIS